MSAPERPEPGRCESGRFDPARAGSADPEAGPLRRLLADERADATLEYVLLVAFVAVPLGVLAWGGVRALSDHLDLLAELVGDPTP